MRNEGEAAHFGRSKRRSEVFIDGARDCTLDVRSGNLSLDANALEKGLESRGNIVVKLF